MRERPGIDDIGDWQIGQQPLKSIRCSGAEPEARITQVVEIVEFRDLIIESVKGADAGIISVWENGVACPKPVLVHFADKEEVLDEVGSLELRSAGIPSCGGNSCARHAFGPCKWCKPVGILSEEISRNGAGIHWRADRLHLLHV